MHRDIDLHEVRRVATEVRAFLEPLWPAAVDERRADAAGSMHEPPVPASEGMCLSTSVVLCVALQEATDRDWEVGGGSPHSGTSPEGGMLDPEGTWRAHFWVHAGGVLVDVTADQFGYGSVIVTGTDDIRYGDNHDEDDLAAHVHSVEDQAGDWLLAWSERAGVQVSAFP